MMVAITADNRVFGDSRIGHHEDVMAADLLKLTQRAGGRLFEKIVKEPIGRDVELVIGLVRARFDLCTDLGNLVDADVVALERLEQMTDARQLELIDRRQLLGRVNRHLLADRLLNDFLDGRVRTDAVD
jgi:hypothetical protein